MNEDRENIKILFTDILNIITDNYNIIFNNERMELSIVDVSECDNEILVINSIHNTIEIYWHNESYTFINFEKALCFIREKILINEFTIFIDNVNVSENKFHAIAEMLKNLED